MAVSRVASLVFMPLMISTRPIAGAGFENFIPSTCSGLLVDCAMSVTLKVAELVASMTSGWANSSILWKTFLGEPGLLFELQVLGDGFDDEVCVPHIGNVQGKAHVR